MDKTSEPLLELLNVVQNYGKQSQKRIDSHDGHEITDSVLVANEAVAEFLLEHGVILLPVKVGDTVYGVFANYDKEVHKCEVVKSRVVQFKDGTIRCFLDVEFDIVDPFYCDGRLMRCGAQAVFGSDFGEWRRAYLTREDAEAANRTKGA